METKKKPVETLAAGSIVESKCGKCKQATPHIVIAMLAGKPSKVECKKCHATHAYKSTEKPAEKTTKKRASTRSRSGAAAAATQTPEELWVHAMRKAHGPAVKYSMSALFEVGQMLSHSSFGEGVVTGIGSPSVATVTFKDGAKKLVMGK